MSLGIYKKSTEDLWVPYPLLRPGYNVIKIFSEVQKFVRQKKIHLIRRVKAFIMAIYLMNSGIKKFLNPGNRVGKHDITTGVILLSGPR